MVCRRDAAVTLVECQAHRKANTEKVRHDAVQVEARPGVHLGDIDRSPHHRGLHRILRALVPREEGEQALFGRALRGTGGSHHRLPLGSYVAKNPAVELLTDPLDVLRRRGRRGVALLDCDPVLVARAAHIHHVHQYVGVAKVIEKPVALALPLVGPGNKASHIFDDKREQPSPLGIAAVLCPVLRPVLRGASRVGLVRGDPPPLAKVWLDGGERVRGYLGLVL
mmetsp:Transcript_12467/g.35210  ORF Transcript_12467/g.35210 Transcript_12467/m.35210 type:complete len:224 (+) Transcript_12467:697-1368(+)